MSKALAAALRAKGAKSDAPLRDVFGYFDLGGQMREAEDPGMAHGGESGMGTTGIGLEWGDVGNQAEGQNAAPVVFRAPNETLGRAVTWGQQGSDNEGGGRGSFNVDASLLPQTRFGDVTLTGAVDDRTRLYDPSLVYDDPNYGRITDSRNIDTSSWSDYFGPVIMSAAMAGMGALGAPSLATGLVSAGRAVGEGGLRGGAGNILGVLGNVAGLPSWATNIGRLALSTALRRNGKG